MEKQRKSGKQGKWGILNNFQFSTLNSQLFNIIETIGARYLVAALNLGLIFINAKVLGVSGMGLVGIIYASANIAVIFSSILC